MPKKEIFLVPYSHLDSQWRWEFPTTINKYIKSTIDENLYMFEKYDGHQFNFTGAIRYQMMKEYYPEKFEKVKKLIEENRWHLAGTCLEETDALIPSMESMVRNILYGDQWQKKEFNKSSKDYMIPDCFGFPKNMPTVLKHMDIKGFSTNKLTWGSVVGIPFELGLLEGEDGSKIISALNPCKYDSHLAPPVWRNKKRKERLNRLGEKNGIWKSFQYYGVGDIGGAPTEGSVKRALASMAHYEKSNNDMIVKQGAADAFFANITDDELKKMDSYKGDLLLTNHSAGTLTSAAIMKRWNRKNEQLAYAAELSAVMAKNIAGAKYPSDKIEKAWTRVIASQMHDILPGTSTPLAYEYSQNDEVIALNTWTTILEDSAKYISPYISAAGELLLFNPLAEQRSDLVKFDVFGIEKEFTHLKSANGDLYKVLLNDNVCYAKPVLPAASYTRFELVKCESGNSKKIMSVNDSDYILENAKLKVVISKEGVIYSIFDKKSGVELLKNPVAYEFQYERPIEFPSWNMYWKDRKRKPKKRIEKGEVSIINNSDLLATVLITTKHGNSLFKKYVTLLKDDNMVSFKEEIDWFEKGCSLKLALTANMDNPVTTYNWESDRVERGVNYKKLFEFPSRLWTNVKGEDSSFSIIENCKYGYDRPEKNKVRLTLLYTPAIYYIHGFWDQRYHDFGHHTIEYAILANEHDFAKIDKHAREFNLKTRSYITNDDGNSTKESANHSSDFIKLDNKNIGISAVKKCEHDDAIIIRMYNRTNKEVKTKMLFNQNIKAAFHVNGLEETIDEADFSDNKVSVIIPKSGLCAYKVLLEDKQADIKQKKVKLIHDKTVIANEDKQALYPAELLPESIASGNNDFELSKEKLNALECNGQAIKIDKGYNKLILLVGAKKASDIDVLIGDKPHTLHIPSMTSNIGLWDTRLWKNKVKHHLKCKRDYVWFNPYSGVAEGFINRDKIECFTTHTYQNNMRDAYKFGYMFRKEIILEKGVESVTLPKEKGVYVFAATLANEPVAKSIQHLEDKYDF